MKRFLLLGASVLALAAVMHEPAYADPVSAAIVSSLGSGFAGSITGALLRIGVGLAMSKLSTLLAPGAKQPLPQATKTSFKQPLGPRRIVYGRTRCDCTVIYVKGVKSVWRPDHGGKHHEPVLVSRGYLLLMLAVCEGPVDVIEGLYVNDELVTFDANGYATFRDGWGRAYAYRGEEDQAASTVMMQWSGGEWSAGHRCRGVATIAIRLDAEPQIWDGGIPSFSALVRGRKLLDPRSGVTVWSDNPMLQLRDYMTTENRRGGLGETASGISDSYLAAAATACDQLVPFKDPGGDSWVSFASGVPAGFFDTSFSEMETSFSAAEGGVLVNAPGNQHWARGLPISAVPVSDSFDVRMKFRVTQNSNDFLIGFQLNPRIRAAGWDAQSAINVVIRNGTAHLFISYWEYDFLYVAQDETLQSNPVVLDPATEHVMRVRFSRQDDPANPGHGLMQISAWLDDAQVIDWSADPYTLLGRDMINRPLQPTIISWGAQIALRAVMPTPSNQAYAMRPRYRASGIITLDDSSQPKSVIEAMLSSCAGRLSKPSREWVAMAGVWRTPEIEITADWLRGEPQAQTRVSARETFNAVKGGFSDSAQRWVSTDYPSVTSAAYQAEDRGIQKFGQLDLPWTTDSGRAQHLAAIELKRARRGLTIALPCNMMAYKVIPGDIVMLTWPRWNFDKKTFEVTDWHWSVDGEGALGVDLTLREIDPEIFASSPDDERLMSVAQRPDLPQPWVIAPPTELELAQAVTGGTVAATMTWQGAADDRRLGYLWTATKAGSAAPDEKGTAMEAGPLTVPGLTPGLWTFTVATRTYVGGVSTPAAITRYLKTDLSPVAAPSGLTVSASADGLTVSWSGADASVTYGGTVALRRAAADLPDTEAMWAGATALATVDGAQTSAVVAAGAGIIMARFIDWLGTPGQIAMVGNAIIEPDELVQNGAFDSADYWTVFDGVSISDGRVNATNATTIVEQNLTLISGKTYRLKFDYNYTGPYPDFAKIRLVAVPAEALLFLSSGLAGAGSIDINFTATDTSVISIQADSAEFWGTIDNVSLKEVV